MEENEYGECEILKENFQYRFPLHWVYHFATFRRKRNPIRLYRKSEWRWHLLAWNPSAVLRSNPLPLGNTVSLRGRWLGHGKETPAKHGCSTSNPPSQHPGTLHQQLIPNDCFAMYQPAVEQRGFGGALKMTERRVTSDEGRERGRERGRGDGGASQASTQHLYGGRRSVTRRRCPASRLTDNPTSGWMGSRSSVVVVVSVPGGCWPTTGSLWTSRAFWRFARVDGEEHGKHGDGVRQGKLEESVKEETKSAH